MTRRDTPSLGEPGDLRGFPVWHVLRGATAHRVTDAGHGPWWFSSEGGRFDLDAPRGTCYLADDPLVALLEVLGPAASAPVLLAPVLDGRVLWTVALPEQVDAADTTARRARSYGITAELAATTPYRRSRAWAAAFAAIGLGGVRYRARHDPAGGRCLAVFGAAGERRRWRRGRSVPVAGGELVARLRDEAGIAVVDRPPHDDELDATRN